MPRDMSVVEIMTSDVLTVRPEDAVSDVVKQLAARGISGAPVVDGAGRLVGLLDDDDLIVSDARLHAPTVIELFGAYVTLPGERRRYEDDLKHALAATVGDMMDRDPPWVGQDATVEDVATIIVDRQVSRVPVLDEQQRVVGIITRGDLVAAMGR